MSDVIHDCTPAEGEATGLSAIRDVLTVFENTIEDGAETEDWDRDLLARALAELEALTNPAPVPPASDEERMREAHANGLSIGIAMSVAYLIRDRGEAAIALEWWRAGGMTVEDCERIGLDDYDLDPIRAALPPKAGGER